MFPTKITPDVISPPCDQRVKGAACLGTQVSVQISSQDNVTSSTTSPPTLLTSTNCLGAISQVFKLLKSLQAWPQGAEGSALRKELWTEGMTPRMAKHKMGSQAERIFQIEKCKGGKKKKKKNVVTGMFAGLSNLKVCVQYRRG